MIYLCMFIDEVFRLKPPRTFGISLAILLSVFMFTVIPLTQVAVLALVQARASRVELTENSAGALFAGGNFGGISNPMLIIQAMLGVIYLIVALFAWRGRPKSIRVLVVISVCVLTVLYVWDILGALFSPLAISAGFDSGTEISRTLQCIRLISNLLIPLYIVWYLNRAPARAFYRGSYAPSDQDTA